MPPSDTPAFSRWLTPAVLAVLGRMGPFARARKQGPAGGRHRSIQKGSSVEFEGHRPYVTGDDLRRLDWSVYGRTDRFYIRQYLEETCLRATLFLDASGSMAYTGSAAASEDGAPLSKFDYARRLTAALAWLFLRHQDLCGLVAVREGVHDHIPAANAPSQLARILESLERCAPGAATGLPSVLKDFAARLPARGTAVVVTDGFFDPAELLDALRLLRRRHHEVWLLQVLAEEELTFPFEQHHLFRDLEGGSSDLETDPAAIRAEYLRSFNAFLDSLSGETARLGILHHRILTSRPLADTLAAFPVQARATNTTRPE